MAAQDIHTFWITASGQQGRAGSQDAVFPYWSFTKTILATCALKLSETGALDLDAPMDGAAYTLRQLLANTSGLPDYGQLPEYSEAVRQGQPPWSREEMLARATTLGMLFEPGQGWSYSNIGYMFVGDAIEQATGQPLADAIRDMITDPLGLSGVELAKAPAQFATLHWAAGATYHPGWVYHRTLIGTAADAARLLHGLASGQLLRPETLRQMHQRTPLGGPLPGRPWATCGYALGLMSGTMDGAGRSFGHSGVGPFCVNAVYHFPDLEDPLTVASFTDGCDEAVAENDVARIVKSLNSGETRP